MEAARVEDRRRRTWPTTLPGGRRILGRRSGAGERCRPTPAATAAGDRELDRRRARSNVTDPARRSPASTRSADRDRSAGNRSHVVARPGSPNDGGRRRTGTQTDRRRLRVRPRPEPPRGDADLLARLPDRHVRDERADPRGHDHRPPGRRQLDRVRGGSTDAGRRPGRPRVGRRLGAAGHELRTGPAAAARARRGGVVAFRHGPEHYGHGPRSDRAARRHRPRQLPSLRCPSSTPRSVSPSRSSRSSTRCGTRRSTSNGRSRRPSCLRAADRVAATSATTS